MKRLLLPMTVLPFDAVPRLSVTFSRTMLLSPISRVVSSPTNLRSWGIPPTTAPWCILLLLPIRVPLSTDACAMMWQLSPITTLSSMYTNGSTVQFSPSFAPGCMYANGLIIAVLFVFNYLSCKLCLGSKSLAYEHISLHYRKAMT